MPLNKYHALAFFSILAMLLLLGLHLLGLGSAGQAGALSAALARSNSTTTTTSSALARAQQQQQPQLAYRHPIIYDKLTGATNNQISEILGSGKLAQASDYPLDHYQQLQLQLQQQQQQQFIQQQQQQQRPETHPLNQFGPQAPAQEDFFNQLQRQAPPFATASPQVRPLQPVRGPLGQMRPPTPPILVGHGQLGVPVAGQSDSLPSASSLAGRPVGNASLAALQQAPTPQHSPQQQQQQQQATAFLQQPPATYYTPPIFAYNEQPRALDPQLSLLLRSPSVPEAPLAVDEYQARLRQQQQQQQQQLQPPVDPAGPQRPLAPPTSSTNQSALFTAPPDFRPPYAAPAVERGDQLLQARPALVPPTRAAQTNGQRAPLTAEAQTLPQCARTGGPLCTEDPEYPTREIMRALEVFALDRSIEQLLPQSLVHQQPQSLPALFDPLSSSPTAPNSETGPFEPMCRSTSYLAQPRRARNLAGQWKVLVNLPGHKYRGVAVSQMLRLEECSRPQMECALPRPPSAAPGHTHAHTNHSSPNQPQVAQMAPLLPKSRCLQHYENQRLLAWSHQQGLHVDIFRLPVACSCHIRR